jgi:CBS domain containing-hemolysin-like protein
MSLIALLFVLTLSVGWFVAAATATRSVSRIWLRHWAQGRARAVRAVALYLSRPEQLLLTSGLAVTAVAGAVGAALGGRGGDTWSLTLRLLLGATCVLFGGQLLPRAIAHRWARPLVPVLLPSVQVVALIATPFFWLARAFGMSVSHAPTATDAGEPVDAVFRDAAREGVTVDQDARIVSGVVGLADRVVRDVMTPRAEVFAVDLATPPRPMAEAIAGAAYSRVPVYRGSFDNVVGMVHAFDVLKVGPDAPLPIRAVATAIDYQPAADLLATMLRDQRHLCVVADAAGRNAGIVTLEDLLETLVGDIRDEHDEA